MQHCHNGTNSTYGFRKCPREMCGASSTINGKEEGFRQKEKLRPPALFAEGSEKLQAKLF